MPFVLSLITSALPPAAWIFAAIVVSESTVRSTVIVWPLIVIVLGGGSDTPSMVAMAAVADVTLCVCVPPVLVTGNLDVTRDLTDVRDVVRAYFALLEAGVSGTAYNVASGHETSLKDVLYTLIALAGVAPEVRGDPARARADEQRRAVADVGRIRRDTGWVATIPLASTLADVIDDWSERITMGNGT